VGLVAAGTTYCIINGVPPILEPAQTFVCDTWRDIGESSWVEGASTARQNVCGACLKLWETVVDSTPNLDPTAIGTTDVPLPDPLFIEAENAPPPDPIFTGVTNAPPPDPVFTESTRSLGQSFEMVIPFAQDIQMYCSVIARNISTMFLDCKCAFI